MHLSSKTYTAHPGRCTASRQTHSQDLQSLDGAQCQHRSHKPTWIRATDAQATQKLCKETKRGPTLATGKRRQHTGLPTGVDHHEKQDHLVSGAPSRAITSIRGLLRKLISANPAASSNRNDTPDCTTGQKHPKPNTSLRDSQLETRIEKPRKTRD